MTQDRQSLFNVLRSVLFINSNKMKIAFVIVVLCFLFSCKTEKQIIIVNNSIIPNHIDSSNTSVHSVPLAMHNKIAKIDTLQSVLPKIIIGIGKIDKNDTTNISNN